jgi:hypothetical protein
VVKKHLKNEEGFTLVQTLATFILITLLGMGLIMLAFKVSEQITVTQAISHTKNDKTYVTQEAKLTLDSELEKLFSGENLAENPLGTNTNTLDRLMKNFVNEHKVINEGTIGKKKDITYQNKLLNYKIEPGELVSPGDEDEQGWVNGKPSGVVGIEYRAYKVTMPIESIITDSKGEKKIESEYCYEIQWESKDDGTLISETDIWGNIYYQINRPGGLIPLSADSVMRKMANIYHYQDETPDYLVPFPSGDMSKKTLNGTYGLEIPYVADVVDGNNTFKNDVSHLGFEGSLITENGFNLHGADGNSKLTTKNLLALTSQGNRGADKNKIGNLSIDARTGLYLSLDSQNKDHKQIEINNNSRSIIETPNFVINNTISREDSEVGTYISNGSIHLTGGSKDTTDFREYKGNSNSLNLQKNNWDQYQSGNFIISHSKVELSSKSSSSDSVYIEVDNNFMLTNAGLDADLSEDTFSYFEDQNEEIIRQPSELVLKGNNTLLEVKGYSFLDAPKRYQRQLKGDYQPQKQIYVNNQGFNQISLEDKSQMRLGYTGVEAFRLKSQKDSILSMKLLPDLALFNPYFLEKGFNNDEIEGKVILETYEEADKNKLEKMLKERNIPYEVTNHTDGDFSNCENGVVTIYNYRASGDETSYEFVTRYFSYLTELDY